jgi:hypothetical protein
MFCRLRPFYKLFVVQIVFPRNREKMLLSFISSYCMQLWILFRTLHGLLVPCEFCSSRYNHQKKKKVIFLEIIYMSIFSTVTPVLCTSILTLYLFLSSLYLLTISFLTFLIQVLESNRQV